MLHADHSSPTKVRRSQAMRMRREVYPREPQVSVVTQTIYASSTVTSIGTPFPVENTPIPLGPIVGGIAGGMLIVLLAVGGWWWWVSKMREAKAQGAKARRVHDLATTRTGHGKTESTETLNTKTSHSNSQSSHMSEKTATAPTTHSPVQMPSAILAAQQKNPRSPFTHQTTSTTSLASSKYAPLRPSPLALNVVNRVSSAMSENPPTVLVTAPPQSDPPVLSPQSAALRSIVPLPPKVNVVPPSPPPPTRNLDAPATERNQRESVQSVLTVASDYSLDSPVGVAYGGDEMEREAYANPRDDWRASKPDVRARI